MDQRLRRALRWVSQAVMAFSDAAMDQQALLDAIVKSVVQVVPNSCLVSLLSDDGTATIPLAMHADNPAVVEAFRPFLGRALPLNETSLRGGAMERTTFVPVIDLNQPTPLDQPLPFHPDGLEYLRTIGARGMIMVPLKSRGELLGVLSVIRYDKALAPLDDNDRELVEHLAMHGALALGTAKLLRTSVAEAQHRQTLQGELEATRFVDAILEHIPDMVFVKEATELRFVRFNRAGETLLGMPSAQLIGKNDSDFFPPEQASFFIAKDRETLAGKTLVDIPEEPIQTPHGERWLHTKKVPILDEDGTPRYLLGISEDITERKRALAALTEAKDKAEAANRELESFSYSVAHDLRAPLRAIDGFAQALVEDYRDKPLDAIGLRHLERIRAGAQRMAVVIDELLNLSRISRYEHRPERVDLAALARASIAHLERAEPDRKVDVVIADDLVVDADPRLLSIVFDNLLGNAWKFTSKTKDARIEVGVLPEQRTFFVRDNGAGFDMTYQNKLFGVFQRLHPAHEFPGTGIGLATVKRIIERHGGRVWAEGALGKGATFFFTLGANGSERSSDPAGRRQS